jgi:DNA helicase II / ATP-dependent DNA helicase PcrA
MNTVDSVATSQKLSQAQQEIVRYIGKPMLVAAGAGSGKTRTVIEKIIYLIQKGYSPHRILAITFTNKAANEMKTRLGARVSVPLFKFKWVRTFHSACLLILKDHLDFLGYSYIQVFDESKKDALLKEIVCDVFKLDKKYIGFASGLISEAKNSGNPKQTFSRKIVPVGETRAYEIYNTYNAALRKRNAVDFDDLLMLTRDLLAHDEKVREQYRQLFQFIFVDEWQDSNTVQADIIRLLEFNGNVMLVGDDWQSIYGFRGSNIKNFIEFDKLFADGIVFKLEQNYRSASEIVNLSNKLIQNNRFRTDKVCFSDIPGGLISFKTYGDERSEAAEVVNQIRKLFSDRTRLSEIAVLYRASFLSLNFEKSLRSAGIPYQIVGGKGFFERKEILDLLAYLTLFVYPKDDEAFRRVLSVPRRGIGPKTIEKIRQSDREETLMTAARNAVAEKKIKGAVFKELSNLFQILDSVDAAKESGAILTELIKKIRYEEYLNDYCKGDKDELLQRTGNVYELVNIAEGQGLSSFLEDIALFTDKEVEDNEDKVSLMTVHKSKGTEFNAVFMVGCEDGLFPHYRMMDEGLEEERRLFYVGMTRAKQYLHISCAGFRFSEPKRASRFLHDIVSKEKAKTA